MGGEGLINGHLCVRVRTCASVCVCGRAGISNAVGMAIAQSHLAANFNAPGLEPVVDNYTYVICGRVPCFMPPPLHLVLCMHLRFFSVCVCGGGGGGGGDVRVCESLVCLCVVCVSLVVCVCGV